MDGTGRERGEAHPAKIIVKTPVVTVRSGPVVNKRSGRTKEFYFFDFPDWVNIVAVTPDKQIVLIQQYRYGSNRLELEIPGGMINRGEDPVDAGCRELREETGFVGKRAELIGKVCPNPAIQGNTCYTVLVENAQQVAEPCFDDMEDIECFPEPESQVFERIRSGSIDHGLVLNALMFYLEHRR